MEPLRQGDRKEEEGRGEAEDHEVREPLNGERGEHTRDRGTVGGAQQAGARQLAEAKRQEDVDGLADEQRVCESAPAPRAMVGVEQQAPPCHTGCQGRRH